MRALLAMVAFALSAGAVWAQDSRPAQCRPDAAGRTDHAACVAAAPAGSPWRTLSLINLATDAYIVGDYATAVRFYDQARPPAGQQMFSDVMFHAFRGNTYWQVGRGEEALADAEVALRMLRRDPALNMSAEDYLPAGADLESIYALIIPILHGRGAPQFEQALAAYLALPAGDWVSWANRAGVFEQIGDFERALEANGRAFQQAPSHPGVLNNQCYILTRAGRAGEAMPFCERARAAAPDIAAIRHSVAAALAALGRCEEARREMAEARRLDPASEAYREDLACAS